MQNADDTTVDAPMPRPRRRWGRRVLVTLLVLLLLLVIFQWQAGRRAASGLEAEFAACRAAGEPATVDELNRWEGLRSGTGENAIPLLRDAVRLMHAEGGVWRAATDSLSPPPLTDEEVERFAAVVHENADALAKADKAAAAGRIDWAPQYTSSPLAQYLLSSDMMAQRSMVSLLRAAALLAHHRGDDAEALRRVEQILLVSRAIDHQPFLVHHLVAIGAGTLGTMTAVEVAPDLHIGGTGGAPAAQVRSLIAQLLDGRPLNDGQRRAWVGERVMQLELPEIMLGSGGETVAFGGVRINIPGMRFMMKPMICDNARAMSHYTTAMMKTMASSPDLPSFKASLGDPAPEVTRSPGRYTITSILLPSLNRAPLVHYRALADRQLAATCLAVRLYATDHQGTLPETLDDLVPAYLPSVPLDPLAAGGARLRYVNARTDPQRPRIYSVGLDGTDDGGVEDRELSRPRSQPRPSDEVRHLRRQPRAPAQE